MYYVKKFREKASPLPQNIALYYQYILIFFCFPYDM